MASLLTAVQKKMHIFAHRKARGLLEGEYASIFRGRGLDFEDLRDYVPGDEVRDIDWKATARTGKPLVKRYVATRRQQLLFVVHGDGDGTDALPAGGTEHHVEMLLRRMDAAGLDHGPSDLAAQLEYVAAHYRQRMLLVVVADGVAADQRLAKVLRRLRAQHEILWVDIADADLAGPDAVQGTGLDVAGMEPVLLFLAQDPALARSYAEAMAERARGLSELLAAQGIAKASIASSSEAVARIFALLERHRRGR